MKCPRCQADNRDGARFCRECGATFAAVCPSCGAKVEAGSKFCDSCGAALVAAPTLPAAAPRFASPESYTPKHLAERILTSKSALEGERKQVTVLFADLKGSMELLADRDPEEARKLLDPVLMLMMDAVHRYEGTVNQVMGDGIMALFGAPVALEDHAVRACYAALADAGLRQAVCGGRAPETKASRSRSGWAELGRCGRALHRQRPAHGLHRSGPDHSPGGAHGAARCPGIDRRRRRRRYDSPRATSHVKAAGPRPGQGDGASRSKSTKLMVRAPCGRGWRRSAARGLTRFVGRDAEMELLQARSSERVEGMVRWLPSFGEPGVGKSRLFYEFIRIDSPRCFRTGLARARERFGLLRQSDRHISR